MMTISSEVKLTTSMYVVEFKHFKIDFIYSTPCVVSVYDPSYELVHCTYPTPQHIWKYNYVL